MDDAWLEIEYLILYHCFTNVREIPLISAVTSGKSTSIFENKMAGCCTQFAIIALECIANETSTGAS